MSELTIKVKVMDIPEVNRLVEAVSILIDFAKQSPEGQEALKKFDNIRGTVI